MMDMRPTAMSRAIENQLFSITHDGDGDRPFNYRDGRGKCPGFAPKQLLSNCFQLRRTAGGSRLIGVILQFDYT